MSVLQAADATLASAFTALQAARTSIGKQGGQVGGCGVEEEEEEGYV